MHLKIRILASISVVGFFSACGSAPMLAVKEVGDTRMITSSAGANVSTVAILNGVETNCVRLGPDAASDVNDSLNLISLGSNGGGESFSDDEVEMIGRTPVNALVRDSLFHLCTLRQSQMITQEQYSKLLEFVLTKGFSLSGNELEKVSISIQSTSAGLTGVPEVPTTEYHLNLGPSNTVPPVVLPNAPVGTPSVPPVASPNRPPPPPPPPN